MRDGMMNAAVFNEDLREIALERRNRPKVSDNDVLVAVAATGICGSDLHVVAGTSPEPMTPRPVLGHETMGVVEEIGANVKGLQLGQRVGVEPLVGCGTCPHCRTGSYHLCEGLELIGMERSGGFADYLVAPADKVFPLPDQVSDSEAAILDCVAVAVHVLHRLGMQPGRSVAVLGAGTIGNIIAQLARAWGAKKVGITDRSDYRLETAKQVGIEYTYNVTEPHNLDRLLADMGEVDYVIEAVGGSAPTINQALDIVTTGGRICFMGIFTGSIPVNLWNVLRKEVAIVPAWSYASWGNRREFEIAIDILAQGLVDVKPLITGHYSLAQVNHAFEDACDQNKNLKIIVSPTCEIKPEAN